MPLSAFRCRLAAIQARHPWPRWNHKRGDLRRLFFRASEHFLSLACALWPPRVLRIAPVDRLQQITHLRRGQPHHTAHRHRPDKTPTVQPLGVERQSNYIVPQGLDQRTAASTEHEDISGERITT